MSHSKAEIQTRRRKHMHSGRISTVSMECNKIAQCKVNTDE